MFIPILGGLGLCGSGGLLAWYYRLSERERQKADDEATELAKVLFKKSLSSLNGDEAKRIHDMTKKFFDK